MRFAGVPAMVGMTMVAGGTGAAPRSDGSVIRALWSDPGASQGLFSEGFLRQAPITQIAKVVTDLVAKCGDLETVRPSANPGRPDRHLASRRT